MPEASISVTMRDKVSDKLKAMAGSAKAFNEAVEGLQIKLKTLDRRQSDLADSMTDCRKKVKEYRKEFEETGSALSKMKLDDARDTLQGYSRELGDIRRESKETQRAIANMQETASKPGDSKILAGINATTKSMAAAGIGQLVSKSLGEVANVAVSSMFGTDGGDMVNSVLSGIISGAAMGSIGGIGIGTIIGGIVGGISGAISSEAKRFAKQDDYFKAYYNGIIDEQAQQRTSDIQMGSSIAAGRETDLISFSRLFKSRGMAERYLDDLVSMANTTPFLYGDLTAMSKTLAAYGYGAADILPTLTKIGDAGAALGMGTDDMTMVAATRGGFLLILR